MSNINPEDNSDIPEVRIPDGGFKAEIPEFLLQDCSPKERYILEQLGALENYTKWSAPIAVDSNRSIRRTNGRVNRAEDDIKQLKDQIQSWINFKMIVHKVVTNKYFIIAVAVLALVILFPVVSYITSTGGLVKFAEIVIKLFTG